MYHYTTTTTTTTTITTAPYHYRYVCVYVYLHMTKYVYNICEGIVKKKIASERERKKKLGDSVSLTKSFFPFVCVCYLFTFFSSLPVRFIFSYFFSPSPHHHCHRLAILCIYIYYIGIRSHTSALRVLKETERDVRTHTRVYYIDCV